MKSATSIARSLNHVSRAGGEGGMTKSANVLITRLLRHG